MANVWGTSWGSSLEGWSNVVSAVVTLWIREFSNVGAASPAIGLIPRIALPIAQEPGVDQEPITLTGSSTQSAAFGSTTKYIMVISNATFNYAIGLDPTATASSMYVPAGVPYSVGVRPGYKIAVIAS